MKSEYNIAITGVGGQGILSLAKLIGNAALKEGKNVFMSEIHGLAQRGGAVTSELRIGDVHSPLIEGGEADVIVALEPVEAIRILNKASSKTYFLVNIKPIIPFTVSLGFSKYPDMDSILNILNGFGKSTIAFDAVELAEQAGSAISLNVVMLGALSTVSCIPVSENSILSAMELTFSKETFEVNKRAFDLGKSKALKLTNK